MTSNPIPVSQAILDEVQQLRVIVEELEQVLEGSQRLTVGANTNYARKLEVNVSAENGKIIVSTASIAVKGWVIEIPVASHGNSDDTVWMYQG